MGLKDGDLASLVQNDISLLVPLSQAAREVFFQMLQALDYLAAHEIVHRDVKPANILYSVDSDGKYTFQLGDFGLCNRSVIATSLVGSPLFMAPELLLQNEIQTPKVDVWSLYVTIIWMLDIKGFRDKSQHFRSSQDVREAILGTTLTSNVISINEMARVNPAERASAAQMLVKCFSGAGLTTPRHSILPIVVPMVIDAIIQVPAFQSPLKRTHHPNSMRLNNTHERQKARFRVGK